MASDKTADGGELASLHIDPVEYMLAIGVFKTRLADGRVYLRRQQGPEPLANCIPASQNGCRVPAMALRQRKRVRSNKKQGNTEQGN